MQKLGLNELRERYLAFFEKKGHLRLPSFSLVPQNDASLLLINSGMAPLKPYFTGAVEPPRRRVTTCQKCIRTPDIENVGKTARHGTFFEMLGNFSFGNYFKKEVIPWAWEFITEDLKMPKDRLWISIYQDDDEAFEIWNKTVGVPAEKIVRLGKEDNFWEHGIGPCGPCSEIYFDRGAEKGCGKLDCKIGCDCDRYVEFWNLVFTQFNRDEEGNYSRLANPNIDTGMGLERLACIMQDVNNLFEVDTVKNILSLVCKIAGVEYGKSEKSDISIRVITDHVRSITMMAGDGIIPSNEGRGYVLRRLLRRAARHGKLLGINRPFLCEVVKAVINESKQAYPELEEKADYIQKVIGIEEERFAATIDQGLGILNEYIMQAKNSGKNILEGSIVFKLHDTYGFPLDLTREISEENGLAVDEAGFKKEMDEQKKKAREALSNKNSSAWGENTFASLDEDIKTEFEGYVKSECDAEIRYIIKDDKVIECAVEGDQITIILDRTPFYAESGGQIGDSGYITSKNGKARIEDTKKTSDGKYLHIGVVVNGIIEKGAEVKASIDNEKRMAIARNHTSTHMLQKALRNVLGNHVEQAGSLVDDEKLRFDFNHFSALTSEEISKVENEVNRKILEGLDVIVKEMPIDEAKKLGAMALFGEKYGDVVRVVRVGNYSVELCGGTHLQNSSRAGLIKIISESGVAAGVRRIEALTGLNAIRYYDQKEDVLNETAAVLKSNPQDLVSKAENLISDIKSARKEIEQLKNKLASSSFDDIIKSGVDISGIKIISGKLDGLDMEGLRNAADSLKSKVGTGTVILAGAADEKVNIIVTASKDAVDKGIHCGNIIKKAAKAVGGGGGGRPDMAQAGGKDASKIQEALDIAVSEAQAQIKS